MTPFSIIPPAREHPTFDAGRSAASTTSANRDAQEKRPSRPTADQFPIRRGRARRMYTFSRDDSPRVAVASADVSLWKLRKPLCGGPGVTLSFSLSPRRQRWRIGKSCSRAGEYARKQGLRTMSKPRALPNDKQTKRENVSRTTSRFAHAMGRSGKFRRLRRR